MFSINWGNNRELVDRVGFLWNHTAPTLVSDLVKARDLIEPLQVALHMCQRGSADVVKSLTELGDSPLGPDLALAVKVNEQVEGIQRTMEVILERIGAGITATHSIEWDAQSYHIRLTN